MTEPHREHIDALEDMRHGRRTEWRRHDTVMRRQYAPSGSPDWHVVIEQDGQLRASVRIAGVAGGGGRILSATFGPLRDWPPLARLYAYVWAQGANTEITE